MLQEVSKPKYVEAMVQKYVDGVIDNVVGYREVSKIARAELAGVDKRAAIPVLIRLVKEKSYSIENAYRDTVQAAYDQRDLRSKLEGITARLAEMKTGSRLSPQMKAVLEGLRTEIDRLLVR